MAPQQGERELIRIAVFFAYAKVHKLTPRHCAAVPHPGATTLAKQLLAQGATLKAEQVFALTHATCEALRNDPKPLSAVAYDKVRKQVLSRIVQLDHPIRLWPPTSQTVRAQLGGGTWNDAMTLLGIPVSSRGRARGHIGFSDHEYSHAVADFLAASPHDTSYRAYEGWVAAEKGRGVRRPAGATIRKSYGSWNGAKDAAAKLSP